MSALPARAGLPIHTAGGFCPALHTLPGMNWLTGRTAVTRLLFPAAHRRYRRTFDTARRKGVKAFVHEQAGKPAALPQGSERIYMRKSHEHNSQATSALLWVGQISSRPLASTTTMLLVGEAKPLSALFTLLAARRSAFFRVILA